MAKLKQVIVPHLWYDKEAKEAADFYCSIFPDSRVNYVTTIHDTPSGDCDIVSFTLAGQDFMSISAGPMFKFNEAISLMVYCDTQQELDHYWNELSAVPAAEQCGWIKDKYGLSWQIVPRGMDEMLADPDHERVARVTKAVLGMKKLDLPALRRAYDGSQAQPARRN